MSFRDEKPHVFTFSYRHPSISARETRVGSSNLGARYFPSGGFKGNARHCQEISLAIAMMAICMYSRVQVYAQAFTQVGHSSAGIHMLIVPVLAR